MIDPTHLYISSKGGSITCFRRNSIRIFQSCFASHCVYSGDLHSAKSYLEKLEFSQRLTAAKRTDPPTQRKTTLKWNVDGELSSFDMARILDRLAHRELTQCHLSCDLEDPTISYQEPLPSSSWIP